MISAVIITYNAARHISECITSLLEITSDIIVVDAESSDHTKILAQDAGAQVFEHKWKGYGKARNYGAIQAGNDWILTIDADERCDEQLINSLSNEELKEDSVYVLKRRNFYAGDPIKYGMLRPEWKIRLYHRRQAAWDDKKVHEQLSFDQQKISVKRLDGELLHFAYKDRADHLTRLDHYAKLSAMEWKRFDYRPNKLVQLMSPVFHFFRAYILKLGFVDLKHGIETSRAAYFYHRQKYFYYNAIRKDSEN